MDKEINKEIANKLINNGEVLRSFKETPAYALIRAWINDKVADTRDAWIKATPEQAEGLRHKAGAYKELLDFIEHQVKVGEVYNDLLKEEAKRKGDQYVD